MDASTGEEPPPKSTDLAGWRQAITDGRFREFPLEAIAAATQDLGPDTDRAVRNALAKHLSASVYRLLDRNVGRNHPNQGRDIVDRVHDQFFEALAKPQSADGKGIRQALVARVLFRLKDAIAKEARERRIPDEADVKPRKKTKKSGAPGSEEGEEVKLIAIDEHPDLIAEVDPSDGEVAAPSKTQWDQALLDGVREADEKIGVDRFLEDNIVDARKRLAFRLFMDDFPYKSGRSVSIAKALGIDEKTARQWIEDTQERLKKKIGGLT